MYLTENNYICTEKQMVLAKYNLIALKLEKLRTMRLSIIWGFFNIMPIGIKLDLTGQSFGKLTVINKSQRVKGKSYWECVCICGKNRTLVGSLLISGKVGSCGCDKAIKKGNRTVGDKIRTEYRAWINMKNRCTRVKDKNFHQYGGRGISICDRWINSFENFFEDMGLKPTPKHSLERIDVNGNYEPSNCKWATNEEQHRNKRNNRWVEYNGQRMIISDWARYFGIERTNMFKYMKSMGIEKTYDYYLAKFGKLPCPTFEETKKIKT